MNDTDKRKTLYDEIFTGNKAPEVMETNGNREIKDAIDSQKFDDKDIVNLEDIFIFDDKNKESVSKVQESSNINLDDANYYDLINNTLVDLRLDLENTNLNKTGLYDVDLNSLIKDTTDTDVKQEEMKSTSPNDFKETVDLDKESVKSDSNNKIVADLSKKDENSKNETPFWINYALVAALIVVSIVGSLTFLMKQFMR